MRIIFMGTPDFAVPSLRILLDNSYEISGVVTAPDKPRGRGQSVSYTPVKEFALTSGLRIMQPDNIDDSSFVSDIKEIAPDLIVVVAFRMLPEKIFTVPRSGSFNLHASLLPKYRGAAPINWAIINGEKETGVTTFFLQREVDAGMILLQERVAIGPDESAGELHDRLSQAGARTVLQTVRLIEQGKAKPFRQDNSLATRAPKIFKDDCRIDWKKTAMQIYNFIRGLSPYPAAWTTHKGRILKLYRSSLVGSRSAGSGIVCLRSDDALHIGSRDGVVSILEIQLEGKRRLGIEEFLRGYRIEEGESFD